MSPVARDLFTTSFRPFLQGLSESGYVEGRNVVIDYRSTEGCNDLLPAVLADLLRRQVTVIAAAGNSQVVAAKAATTTIPIVFLTGGDPVKFGFVANLNKPGGNLAGVNTLGLEVAPKRLELVRELLPAITSTALLVNPSNPISTESETKDMQTAARSLGMQLHVLRASSERDFDSAFASIPELRAGALVILTDASLNSRSEQLAALALRHGVPAIFRSKWHPHSITSPRDIPRLQMVTTSTAVRTRSPPAGRSFNLSKSRSVAPGVMLFRGSTPKFRPSFSLCWLACRSAASYDLQVLAGSFR